MNSLFNEEKQLIYKCQSNPSETDLQQLIDLKKKHIHLIQSKPIITKYDTYVHKYCKQIFSDKKNILISEYHFFSNLYEYIKLHNLEDSKEILEILNKIEIELLSII
jgi:hypothetical protein